MRAALLPNVNGVTVSLWVFYGRLWKCYDAWGSGEHHNRRGVLSRDSRSSGKLKQGSKTSAPCCKTILAETVTESHETRDHLTHSAVAFSWGALVELTNDLATVFSLVFMFLPDIDKLSHLTHKPVNLSLRAPSQSRYIRVPSDWPVIWSL